MPHTITQCQPTEFWSSFVFQFENCLVCLMIRMTSNHPYLKDIVTFSVVPCLFQSVDLSVDLCDCGCSSPDNVAVTTTSQLVVTTASVQGMYHVMHTTLSDRYSPGCPPRRPSCSGPSGSVNSFRYTVDDLILLGHMQVCTSLLTDNHTRTPPLSYLQAGCPSCRPTNSVKALIGQEKCKITWKVGEK